MSVNTAHTNGGVLIHYGEYILIHSENVSMDFAGQDNPIFKGTKYGHIYLTSHRMIFNSKKQTESMMSFSAPFIAMSDVDIEQPVFGANYIKGKVRAQPNGNFIGEVKFKLYFKSGGAIEYGQAMLRAASIAQQNLRRNNGNPDDPPPYTPSGSWHEAPPPAYQPPPGYYGWIPTNDAFTGPAPNSVFVSDNPPPYPGIGTPPAYGNHQDYPSVPQQGGFVAPGGYPTPPQSGGYPAPPQGGGYAPPQGGGYAPPADGYPQGGYGPPAGGYPQGGYGPPPSYAGFNAPPQGGFSGPPQQGGYPPYGQPPYGQPGASAPPQGQYNPGQANGYPGYPGGSSAPSGAMGFSAPPANSKEAEALRSAFNTSDNQGNNQRPSDMPPPSYGDLPPNYNSLNDRRNQ